MADVSPFTPDYVLMQLFIVYVVVRYDCPLNGELYILVIRNTLYVPSMRNNLLTPFGLHEEGIKLNETPNIQVNKPTIEDHSQIFSETGF